MFIYVALRGPRCPHTQQRVERATAGHNASHISCLSHMAVLSWPWLLPHLPSHLTPRSLFFPTSDWLPQSPYCVATSPPKPDVCKRPCPPLCCRGHNKSARPRSVQAQSPSQLHNLSSVPPPLDQCPHPAKLGVGSHLERRIIAAPSQPSIHSQMAC